MILVVTVGVLMLSGLALYASRRRKTPNTKGGTR